MNYSHIFGSNFPDEIIDVGTKKDIDDSVKDLVAKYYSYLDAKDINSAVALYNDNKNILKPYIVNSNYFNMLEESIYNTGILALNKISTIISDTEPVSQSENSHWLKEF